MLAASSDGVGTKLAIAQAMDKHDTVGLDLVAMVVDDLVVCGAEPLFLLDYIAVGRIVPERLSAIVAGIADGCMRAGCALLGGETAEHPGLIEPDHYDISATGVGVVEADNVLGPDRVKPGDVIIAMGSSGLHSNGYSLVRKVLLEIDRMNLAGHVEEFGRTWAKSYWSRLASTPKTVWPWPPKPVSGRFATSPAAGSPATCNGSSRMASSPRSTAAPGHPRRYSP